MVEEPQTLLERGLEAVQNLVRTEVAPHRDIVRMAKCHEAAEQREMIEEARAARITTALSDMADAMMSNERPAFRSDEHAAAFRRDVEARYGEGAFEQIRAGDTKALSQDVPDDGQRALMAAAVRLVAESHESLRNNELDRPAITPRDRAHAASLGRDGGSDYEF